MANQLGRLAVDENLRHDKKQQKQQKINTKKSSKIQKNN